MLDHRNHQAAAAVLALHIHRQAQVIPVGGDPMGRALDHRERVGHHRMLLGRLHQRPRDEVGERRLLGSSRGLERGIEPARAASSASTGISRKVVAVGTERLSVMLARAGRRGP